MTIIAGPEMPLWFKIIDPGCLKMTASQKIREYQWPFYAYLNIRYQMFTGSAYGNQPPKMTHSFQVPDTSQTLLLDGFQSAQNRGFRLSNVWKPLFPCALVCELGKHGNCEHTDGA